MSTIRSQPIIKEIAQRDAVPIVISSAPRVQLTLQSPDDSDTVIQCRHVVTLLGSKSGCKAVLQHRKVSPVHAAIVNDGAHVFLVDLVTQEGTKLNGLRVEQEHLSSGDVISICRWKFGVEVVDPDSTGHADAHPFNLDAAHHTVVLEHLDTGRILKPKRNVCVIGRREGCDVTLTDKSVSRTHALLIGYLGRPAIVDLLSRNNTLVNGDPVSFRPLSDGDVISLGDSRFRVRILGTKAKSTKNGQVKVDGDGVPCMKLPAEGDLINIAATEGSQRWRVAEGGKSSHKKSGVA